MTECKNYEKKYTTENEFKKQEGKIEKLDDIRVKEDDQPNIHEIEENKAKFNIKGWNSRFFEFNIKKTKENPVDYTENTMVNSLMENNIETLNHLDELKKLSNFSDMVNHLKNYPEILSIPQKQSGDIALHFLCSLDITQSQRLQGIDFFRKIIKDCPKIAGYMNNDGKTPLHIACQNPHVSKDVIELLLKNFPEVVSIRDKQYFLPLHYLCRNRKVEKDLIQLVMTNELISVVDKNGWTPLHHLSNNPCISLECVELFSLMSNEPFAIADNLDRFPLHMICKNPKLTLDLFSTISNQNPMALKSYDKYGYSPLHYYCENPSINIELLQNILASNPEAIMNIDHGGQIPLHILCSNKSINLEMLHNLLKAEIKCIQIKDNQLSTPFHLLCMNPSINLHMFRLIVAYSNEIISVQDVYGATPLHYICQNPSITKEILWAFLDEYSFAAHMLDKKKKTPLHHLCCNPSISSDLLSYLLNCYPNGGQLHDDRNRLPIQYVLKNINFHYSMAAILTSNRPIYRQKYIIQEEASNKASIIFFRNEKVITIMDQAIDVNDNSKIILKYFSSESLYLHEKLTLQEIDKIYFQLHPLDASSYPSHVLDTIQDADRRVDEISSNEMEFTILQYCIATPSPQCTFREDVSKFKDKSTSSFLIFLNNCLVHICHIIYIWHEIAQQIHGCITLDNLVKSWNDSYHLINCSTSTSIYSPIFLQPNKHVFMLSYPPEYAKHQLNQTSCHAHPSFDIWMLGCTIYEICCGKILYQCIFPWIHELTYEETLYAIASINDQVIQQILDNNLCKDQIKIVSAMLKINPDHRCHITYIQSLLTQEPEKEMDSCMNIIESSYSSKNFQSNDEEENKKKSKLNQEIENIRFQLQYQRERFTQEIKDLIEKLVFERREKESFEKQSKQLMNDFMILKHQHEIIQEDVTTLITKLDSCLLENEEIKQKYDTIKKKEMMYREQLQACVQQIIPFDQKSLYNGIFMDETLNDSISTTFDLSLLFDQEKTDENPTNSIGQIMKKGIRLSGLTYGCIGQWANSPGISFSTTDNDRDTNGGIHSISSLNNKIH